ncbi:MAG: cyclic nucleotide-binding domain-containing protein [Thermoanaerobaculia bacterium]
MSEINFLQEVRLFGRMSEADLGRIAKLAERRELAPGELVLAEGDSNDALHVLREGRVRVTRTVDGDTLVLSDLSPGATFGELSVLGGRPAAASLHALPRSVVLSFPAPALERFLGETPAAAACFWRALALELGERLLRTNDVVRSYFAANRTLLENPSFRDAWTDSSR